MGYCTVVHTITFPHMPLYPYFCLYEFTVTAQYNITVALSTMFLLPVLANPINTSNMGCVALAVGNFLTTTSYISTVIRLTGPDRGTGTGPDWTDL